MVDKNKHIKLLFIEDNLRDIQFVKEALAETGHELFDLKCADCLKAALERLDKETFDEIILDLSLPDSQGFDTLKKIHHKAPHIPIVVLTVFQDPTFALSMIREGAQDYLIKGKIDKDLLWRVLQYAIERKRIEEELKKYHNHLEDLVKERTTKLEQEIAERKRIEEALRESEEKFRSVVENIAIGASLISPKMEILSLNKIMREWFPEIDVSKKPLCYRVFNRPSQEAVCSYCPTYKTLQDGQVHESITQTPAGDKILNYRIISSPIKNKEGKTIAAIEMVEDITERKKLEEELKNYYEHLEDLVKERTTKLEQEIVERKLVEEEIEKFKTIADNANYGVVISGLEGNLAYINDYFANIHGYTPEELRGKNLAIFHTEEQLKQVREINKKLKETGSYSALEVWHKHKDGSVFPMLMSGIIIKDEENRPLFMAATAIDITEYKKGQQEREKLTQELLKSNKKLRKLSLIDPQTGLYNHRYLEEAIEAEFQRARRYYHPLSVILLDIDYFKSINDVYGHKFGDLVLIQFAGQLKKMVRRYDIVSRFGGEEFMILSPGTDRPSALTLAQRILDAINLYNFGDKKHSVKLKLSIAIASYPEDKIFKGMDLVDLSDQIIGKVKEYGGNRVYSSLDIQKEKDTVMDKIHQRPEITLLKSKLDKLTRRAKQGLLEAIFAFSKTIEVKDHYTGEHVERTVYYATEIAHELKLSKEEIELVRQATMLHDLGKVGISERILLKKSKLTKEEFEEIKKHPQIGADILRPIQLLHGIIPLIYYHHERWDGKGYLTGLKGEEIPIGGRIIALADVYQALISDRPYRKAYSKEKAISIISNGSGSQFDPRIVDTFLRILQKRR